MNERIGIVWFRQDLRLHDNEALTEALKNCTSIIPVYIFDERVFRGKTRFGFPKTGKYRAKFIVESVRDLKSSLQKRGSDLVVRTGKPEEEIFKIARQCRSSWIFCNRERTREELDVQDALEHKLWSIGQEIRFSRGKMLYYTADLPFPITHTPDVFSYFRKEVERIVGIREPLPIPKEPFNEIPADLKIDNIPTIEDFGHELFESDERSVYPFVGGESEALKILKNYFYETQNPKSYRDSKNDFKLSNLSTKFSPWLAQGCLSPKVVYQELKNFEFRNGKNKSTLELFHDLMYRDFLRFMGKKHGDTIFTKGGIIQYPNANLREDWTLFHIWKDGRTGIPIIDANMRELNLTGYISSRGRQNVASFLVNDLHLSWQMGAEYFESKLIDYDPCSNWVNWNLVAGLAYNHKEDRHINVLALAKRLDPNGAYVRKWLPELQSLPKDRIHKLEDFSSEELKNLNFKIGADYPRAMISLER
ncbi:DASH family cryptochrome [Saprospiraceae bacterium]|nr:DASH family cryptochrome [Saprospiraceae bacterium]